MQCSDLRRGNSRRYRQTTTATATSAIASPTSPVVSTAAVAAPVRPSAGRRRAWTGSGAAAYGQSSSAAAAAAASKIDRPASAQSRWSRRSRWTAAAAEDRLSQPTNGVCRHAEQSNGLLCGSFALDPVPYGAARTPDPMRNSLQGRLRWKVFETDKT